MKKLFMSMMGLALAIGFGTSCSEEKINPGEGAVKVQFTVAMDGEQGSRSFNDGKSANQLIFAVYNANGEELSELRQDDIKFVDKTAIVETELVKGKTYDFVFWAQPDGGVAFDVSDLRAVKINYNEATLKNNNEVLDAFYKAENDVYVTGPVKMDVTLTRPFAQINFATSKADWESAVNAGIGKDIEIATQITVNGGIYTTLYTRTGEVADEVPSPLTFVYSQIPTSDNTWLPNVDALDAEGNPGNDGVAETYRWLGMTYVLVKESMANDVKLDVESPTVGTDVPVANVPMKRNYRTNIVGNLLTTGAVFNVTIDNRFTNDVNMPVTIVENVADLQAAIDNAKVGDNYINFGQDIIATTTQIYIVQKEGVNLFINGNGYKFDGVFNINGNARAAGAETLKFENIKFVTAGSDFTFISAPSKVNGRYSYAHNVTIENCTFTANQTVGCASFTQAYNIVMKNCKANNVHSILQAQSIDNTVYVEGVEVASAKNGISFGNTAYPILKNSTISATAYGVRADGNASRGNLVVEKSTITAETPVFVRKVTTSYNVDVTTATLVKTGSFDVIFTNGDDDLNALEAPTGKYTIVGADEYVVFPVMSEVANEDELVEALKEGGNVKMTCDIVLNKRLDIDTNVDVCLDMNGKKLTVEKGSSADYLFIIREGSSLTIEGDGIVEVLEPTSIFFYPAGNLVVENGTFVRTLPDGYDGEIGSMFVGTKPAGGWESTGVVIKGGYFDNAYYDANAADIDELLAGTKTLVETADDIKKRGVSGDKNLVRVAIKNNIMKLLNRSNNYFKVYGGSFVGANPAWGDEGCMLPTTPQYLRPWSYYQGSLLDGQTFNENGVVLPEGYAITKVVEDGRPIYTVTYSK